MRNLEIAAIVNAYLGQKGKEGYKLPAAIAWKRRVNMDKLIKAKELIDEALRDIGKNYMDDEHSVKAENGDRQVKPEFRQEFFKAQAEILEQDTEVDIRKVTIADLGDIELSDADMDTLAFMIEEGE